MTPAPALPEELTIFTVGEWHPRLLACLSPEHCAARTDGILAFDASGVAEVDGAGVQLLLALSNSAQRLGLRLELAAPSAGLAGACRTLGAGDLLGDVVAEGLAP